MEQEYSKNVLKLAEKNMRLFPLYKMLSWDLLFHYAIVFIFLTQVKGISAAQFLYAEAFYTAFKIILQVPCTALIDKIRNRNSLIIGNLSLVLHVFILIFSNGMSSIILANLLAAFAFNIKGIAESNVLYDSVATTNGKKSFSKIDGRGSALYYYFEAITSLATGFLYIVNPYIPFVICLGLLVIGVMLSFEFKDISLPNNSNSATAQQTLVRNFRSYMAELKHAFRYIFKSTRLNSFILFSFVCTGLLALTAVYRKSLLTDLGVPAQYLGIIFAISGIITGIAAQNQDKFHNKFKNKTFGVLSLTLTISCIIIAIVSLTNMEYPAIITLVLIMFTLQFAVKGPYYTLQKKYMNNFSDPEIRTKIYSAMNLIESIGRTLIALLGGYLLEHVNTTIAFLILGIISTLVISLILKYMKTRFGLKPDEYKKEDITYVALK